MRFLITNNTHDTISNSPRIHGFLEMENKTVALDVQAYQLEHRGRKTNTRQGAFAMSNDKAYEVITARILDSLTAGILPWRRPWSLPAGVRPRSVTGHAYKGINAVVKQVKDSLVVV